MKKGLKDYINIVYKNIMETVIPENIWINNETHKMCKRGSHIVLRSQFNKESRSQDGLSSACKACTSLKNKKFYQKYKARDAELEKQNLANLENKV